MATLRLKRAQMVPSSEASRNFGELLNRVKETEQLFITRNNTIEAVLMDIELFERLAELEDLVEHLEIAGMISERQSEPEVGTLAELLAQEGIEP